MKNHTKLLAFACMLFSVPPCSARSKKTRLYRNERSNFCLYVPADWRGPAEVKNHAGAAFGAPDAPVGITIGMLSDQPRSIILQQPDAGSQMAALDDFRGATLKEWKTDPSLTDVKQKVEERTTLQQVPALHTVLIYKRNRERRRYEAVFALWNQTQYSVEYDAPAGLARRYEKTFQNVLRTFQFQCGPDQPR